MLKETAFHPDKSQLHKLNSLFVSWRKRRIGFVLFFSYKVVGFDKITTYSAFAAMFKTLQIHSVYTVILFWVVLKLLTKPLS